MRVFSPLTLLIRVAIKVISFSLRVLFLRSQEQIDPGIRWSLTLRARFYVISLIVLGKFSKLHENYVWFTLFANDNDASYN